MFALYSWGLKPFQFRGVKDVDVCIESGYNGTIQQSLFFKIALAFWLLIILRLYRVVIIGFYPFSIEECCVLRIDAN